VPHMTDDPISKPPSAMTGVLPAVPAMPAMPAPVMPAPATMTTAPAMPPPTMTMTPPPVMPMPPPLTPIAPAAPPDTAPGQITNLKRTASNPPSDEDVLDVIAADQLALRGRSSDFRYVSFAHCAGQGRVEGEMKVIRQVLTFVINSLSRRGAIADLPTIDNRQSIFRIDLLALGWDARLW